MPRRLFPHRVGEDRKLDRVAGLGILVVACAPCGLLIGDSLVALISSMRVRLLHCEVLETMGIFEAVSSMSFQPPAWLDLGRHPKIRAFSGRSLESWCQSRREVCRYERPYRDLHSRLGAWWCIGQPTQGCLVSGGAMQERETKPKVRQY